jgi:mannose-6-phosphate isomerase
VKLAPSRLSPIFVPRIWGTRDLAPLFDLPPGLEPIGEVWLTGEECAFASGRFSGKTLGAVWSSLTPEWTGTRVASAQRIPLLVKFLFPADKLSVQVHPNDDYALAHEAESGGIGKTEMWYAVTARPGAEIALGLRPGVTQHGFRQAIADGTVESCLRPLPVHTGDCFFVPAGTPHMIGPEMVLCEIQQHSDITYRIFDFGRLQPDGSPRPLHVHRALDVMDFGEPRVRRMDPIRLDREPVAKSLLAACKYFATEKWDFAAPAAAATSAESFELLIILSGAGRVTWNSDSNSYGPGQVWLLPAALGEYRLAPDSPTTLLRTYVPDLHVLSNQLARLEIPDHVVSKLVHK